MAARRKRNLRYPRTTQERRYNQDKHDPLIRAKRHGQRLPNSYDDLFPCFQKGWKALGRKTQYREDKTGYSSHVVEYDFWDIQSRQEMHNILRQIKQTGCYYEWSRGGSKTKWVLGIRWFGPDFY